MSYLPPSKVLETEFPLGDRKDFFAQVRQIEDVWRRMYPPVKYYPLSQTPTVAAVPGELSGEDATTQFDPIWGESVDASQVSWKQPHRDEDVQAANVEVREDPVYLHARISIQSSQRDLNKHGFERNRPVILVVPASILDDHNVTVQEGDRFDWGKHKMEVREWNSTGWLWNVNIPLYIRVSAEHARDGS